MAIDQTNIRGIAFLEAKDDAPVGTHSDAPVPREVATQRMKPEARQAEFLWSSSHVEPRERQV